LKLNSIRGVTGSALGANRAFALLRWKWSVLTIAGSPNYFVRGPHMPLHHNSRTGHLT